MFWVPINTRSHLAVYVTYLMANMSCETVTCSATDDNFGSRCAVNSVTRTFEERRDKKIALTLAEGEGSEPSDARGHKADNTYVAVK
jgi:hypothetical protein